MRIEVTTEEPIDVVDVTDRVADAVPDGADGVYTVFVEHTTAGVCLNEAEPRLLADIERFVSELSADEGWRHDELDGNSVERRSTSTRRSRGTRTPTCGRCFWVGASRFR